MLHLFANGKTENYLISLNSEVTDMNVRIEDGVMTYMFHPCGARKLEDRAYSEIEYAILLNRILEYTHDNLRFCSGLRCEYTCIEHGWTSELPDRRTTKTDWIWFGDHIKNLDELTSMLKQVVGK